MHSVHAGSHVCDLIVFFQSKAPAFTPDESQPALRSRCGQYIFALCPVVSFYLFDLSPNLSGRRLDVYHTSTHGVAIYSANLECRSEMCCTQLAGNTGRKSYAKIVICCTIAQICRAISSQLIHESTIGKKLLSSNIYPTCPIFVRNAHRYTCNPQPSRGVEQRFQRRFVVTYWQFR